MILDYLKIFILTPVEKVICKKSIQITVKKQDLKRTKYVIKGLTLGKFSLDLTLTLQNQQINFEKISVFVLCINKRVNKY